MKTVASYLMPFVDGAENNGAVGLGTAAQNKERGHTPVFQQIKQVPRQARTGAIIITQDDRFLVPAEARQPCL